MTGVFGAGTMVKHDEDLHNLEGVCSKMHRAGVLFASEEHNLIQFSIFVAFPGKSTHRGRDVKPYEGLVFYLRAH